MSNDPRHWPAVLAPQSITLRQRGAALVGPQSLDGSSQAVQNDAGLWEVALAKVPVAGPARVLAWRQLQFAMQGGAVGVIVPVWDHEQAPWPAAGGKGANLKPEQAFDDGFLYDDGHGYFDPAILVTLTNAASLRATSIVTTITTAGTITAGMTFSFADDRVHIITDLPDDGSWSIWPPLRSDYIAGAELNFDRPTLKAVLSAPAASAAMTATPGAGDLALSFGRYGAIDLLLRELLP